MRRGPSRQHDDQQRPKGELFDCLPDCETTSLMGGRRNCSTDTAKLVRNGWYDPNRLTVEIQRAQRQSCSRGFSTCSARRGRARVRANADVLPVRTVPRLAPRAGRDPGMSFAVIENGEVRAGSSASRTSSPTLRPLRTPPTASPVCRRRSVRPCCLRTCLEGDSLELTDRVVRWVPQYPDRAATVAPTVDPHRHRAVRLRPRPLRGTHRRHRRMRRRVLCAGADQYRARSHSAWPAQLRQHLSTAQPD
jgi:hypothetical protein